MSQRQSQLKQTEQTRQSNIQEQLHGYKFIKTLGKGNFGKVKLAVHILTGEYVAIKILEKDLIFERADIERISRQIKIMKQVRHPYIIQLYQIIQNSKRLYLIMEYGEGGDLFDLIVERQKIDEKSAPGLFVEIILGLQYLHSKGITHRDMKPQNILLSKNTIKIADFGLGNFFNPGDTLKTACGSPCYASPQMLNRIPYDPQMIDVWSIGIILYAMVCGYLPFEDDNTSKLYQKIKNTQARFPRGLSQQLKQLMKRILDKNPQSRIKIKQMKQNKWLKNQFMKKSNIDFQIQSHKIKQICQLYQIEDQEKLISYLKKNKHNNLTTIYYLAQRKIQNKGFPLKQAYKQIQVQSIKKQTNIQQQQQKQQQKQQQQQKLEIQRQDDQNVQQQKQQKQQQKQQKHFSSSSNYTHQISFSQLNGIIQSEEYQQRVQIQQNTQNDKQQQINQQNEQVSVRQDQKIQQNYKNKQNGNKDRIKKQNTNICEDQQKIIKQDISEPIAQHKQHKQHRQQQSKHRNQLINSTKIDNLKPKNKQISASQKQNHIQKRVQNLKRQQTYYNNIQTKQAPKTQQIKQNSINKQKNISHNTIQHKSSHQESTQRNKLRKNNRMPIQKHTISQVHQQKHPREKPINQKSHSKDTKNLNKSSRTLIGKLLINQPHLIDPDKIVLCSWNRLVSLLSELGIQGKIQYYAFTKQCLYIARCSLKGKRNIQKIIQKINLGLAQ